MNKPNDPIAEIAKLRAALEPFAAAAENYDKFWDEETGGQEKPEGDDDEMVSAFVLGVYLHMVPLSAFRAATAALAEAQS